MTWRVIMQLEAKLELKHEAETYGERLVDEVDAVREWLRRMPLRYPQWPTDPAWRAVVNDFPFIVFYRIDEARRAVVIVALAPTSQKPGYWRGR